MFFLNILGIQDQSGQPNSRKLAFLEALEWNKIAIKLLILGTVDPFSYGFPMALPWFSHHYDSDRQVAGRALCRCVAENNWWFQRWDDAHKVSSYRRGPKPLTVSN